MVVQEITKPLDALPQFGGVEVKKKIRLQYIRTHCNSQVAISSTMMQALLDAVVYLYSYECNGCEQIASKLIALVALQDTLDAFQSPNLPKKRV